MKKRMMAALALCVTMTAACGDEKKPAEKEKAGADAGKKDEKKPAASADAKDGPKKGATTADKPAADVPAPGDAKPDAAETKIEEVAASEWTPVVGPKLPAGSSVAFKVFKGWPKKDALFVVTKEKDNYKARVFADRAYPVGPLGPAGKKLHSVNQVGFFDVDGDGKVDAVIVASFGETGETEKHNALLHWTGTSLEQMKALEEKIGVQKTLDDIKKEMAKLR